MPAYPVVLFLDYDGVLHPVGGSASFPPGASRPGRYLARLPLLESLLRESGLERIGVVVSSTWRVAYKLAQLRGQFAPDLRQRMIGVTPQLERFKTRHARHEEIAAWLAGHPEVRAWVAVDDDLHGFPEQARAQLVATDAQTGLSPRDIDLLRERLRACLLLASAGGPPGTGMADTP
jgi:hypothetical protein